MLSQRIAKVEESIAEICNIFRRVDLYRRIIGYDIVLLRRRNLLLSYVSKIMCIRMFTVFRGNINYNAE